MKGRGFVACGLLTLIIAVVAGCGGVQVPDGTSPPKVFGNEPCDGVSFVTTAQGGAVSLALNGADGAPQATLHFNDDGTYNASRSDRVIVDLDEPGTALYEDGKVCYRFGVQDHTENACLRSLLNTGPFCTAMQ